METKRCFEMLLTGTTVLRKYFHFRPRPHVTLSTVCAELNPYEYDSQNSIKIDFSFEFIFDIVLLSIGILQSINITSLDPSDQQLHSIT